MELDSDFKQPGHLLNLSGQQVESLKLFWIKFLSNLEANPNLEPTVRSSYFWSTQNQIETTESVTDNIAIKALIFTLKYSHPDTFALRFLRARNFNVDNAVKMAVDCITWRNINVHPIMKYHPSSDLLKELSIGKTYFHGRDKSNHAICWVHSCLSFANPIPNVTNHFLIFLMENAQFLISPQETVTIIFDMNKFSLENMDYKSVTFLAECLQNYYPETLYRCYVLNAPWIFTGCWAIIKAGLDSVVQEKISFINSEKLLEIVGIA